MKLHYVGIMSVLIFCVASAQEKTPSPSLPQPRVKLDPSRQRAVTGSTASEQTKASNVPIMLERMEVKEAAPVPLRRPAVEDPTGEFSPGSGGRMLRRDAGGVRYEAGIWPNIELFEEEARFKPTKIGVQFDFLRMKW